MVPSIVWASQPENRGVSGRAHSSSHCRFRDATELLPMPRTEDLALAAKRSPAPRDLACLTKSLRDTLVCSARGSVAHSAGRRGFDAYDHVCRMSRSPKLATDASCFTHPG